MNGRLTLRTFLLLFLTQPLFSQTAQEVIAKAEELLRGETSRGTFEMTVVTPEFTRGLQSWNGSDFTNDDLARESSLSKDYVASVVGEEELMGELCWKLQLMPNPEAAVVWGKLYVWVRQKDFLPYVDEYYDEKGTLVRYMVYTDVKRLRGRTIPTTWTMYNEVKEGHRTEFRILDIKFDIPIPDLVFSFRELERGD
jgi:outer membrane lipoprotein-sorting protein